MAHDGDTLSRSELRAELAELELRLSRLFADRASLIAVELRVAQLESARLEREHQIEQIAGLVVRVEALEAIDTGNQAVSKYRGWIVTGLLAAVLATASLILQYLKL